MCNPCTLESDTFDKKPLRIYCQTPPNARH
uniref:Uncharacterized protein n=1 Tax=Anguilla anguilla TaxID=7936 RepID=A0A0E9U3Q4_ANGAN